MNRIPSSFFDAKAATRANQKPIGHRLGWMLAIFEGAAREKAYLWVGNTELARIYGCSVSACQRILEAMEAEGIIYRAFTEDGRRGRVGIVLFRRANPDFPVADDESLGAVLKQMNEDPDRTSTAKTPCSAPRKRCSSSTAKTPHGIKTSLSLKKDELKKDEGQGKEIQEDSQPSERQRPEAVPVPQADPEPLAALPLVMYAESVSRTTDATAATARPPQATPRWIPRSARAALRQTAQTKEAAKPEPRTPSQLEWLEGLPTDQRERFDEIPVESQAKLLAPHRDQVISDRILDTETARILGPWKEPAADVPIPATTRELWEQLPGAPAHWPQIAAEALAQDFGTDQDRKLWSAFQQLANAVWRGEFPVDAMLDAYRQGMKPEAKNHGAVFNHALKSNGWGGATA